MKALLLLLLLPASVSAQSISPRFTSATVNATTTTTQTIDEVIAHEIFGAAVNTWSGTNVEPSAADITNSSTTWDIVTAGEDWQLEITSRAAGIIETIDIDRTIETESTTTTLSVFAQ